MCGNSKLAKILLELSSFSKSSSDKCKNISLPLAPNYKLPIVPNIEDPQTYIIF